ncbi:hypothetical protein MFM001_23130 [Mycobacterium sp. MFM001]|uniref:hypothetical protein n=1 Tax=Mycobacterium sp. MFM001 TaxID=2049453 RepID=UPI000DA425E6|nr:hypothetical protein [Mycobacterium sp. MFM001]GBE65851.1 hypothetical protein MFM001_23130 [Mycobacterium sp. MFM001]
MDQHNTPQLRLVAGSHPAGTGTGCAMNAISYANGDTEITDYPACSARPLAAFVQWCNDLLAGPEGYLSCRDGAVALELGWQTVGTADVSDAVIHAWVAELLANPIWGVVRYAKDAAAEAVRDIAELHRKAASGVAPTVTEWSAAHSAVSALKPTLGGAALYAVRAARQSIAPLDSEHTATLDAITGHALRAHAWATGATDSARAVDLVRHAIRSWRDLAGFDDNHARLSA